MDALKILSVDDDPFYSDLYREILSMRGYEVLIANDPATGFDVAMANRPALILLDVMMPEQNGFRDGYDLLERLKKEETLKSIPVIMISALGSEDDVKHGLDLGASMYIAKHETVPEKIFAAIEKLTKENPVK